MKKLLAMAAVAAFTFSAQASASEEGQAIYDKACKVCHAMGVAGAPKVHDAAQWEERLKQDMATLVATVKSGKGAMPPMGMCMDCNDEQFQAAIEFMSKPQQ